MCFDALFHEGQHHPARTAGKLEYRTIGRLQDSGLKFQVGGSAFQQVIVPIDPETLIMAVVDFTLFHLPFS